MMSDPVAKVRARLRQGWHVVETLRGTRWGRMRGDRVEQALVAPDELEVLDEVLTEETDGSADPAA
jgi:hypothetical protein